MRGGLYRYGRGFFFPWVTGGLGALCHRRRGNSAQRVSKMSGVAWLRQSGAPHSSSMYRYIVLRRDASMEATAIIQSYGNKIPRRTRHWPPSQAHDSLGGPSLGEVG